MSTAAAAAVLVAHALLLVLSGCEDAAAPPATCDRPATFEKSPGAGLEGAGWHRIYVQGASAAPEPDGRFAMSEHRNEVLPDDHFLLSAGAFVEWSYPVFGELAGEVFFHIARVDDEGVSAVYELGLERDGALAPLLELTDGGRGGMGYIPFEECHGIDGAAGDPAGGARLVLRVTNLTGGMLGIVIRSPDYFTWIDVEVE